MLLCMGPQIRSGSRVVMESAPYGWLMAFPGFEGLRVPTRFWMLGTLCLAVAVALGLDRLLPRPRYLTVAVILIVSGGVLADGWAGAMPMARAPERWSVPNGEIVVPLIELPLGPEFDAAATYRAVGHGRRVVNGVSGYDPPHYAPLRRGLAAREADALLAFTHFGPLDIVVDTSTDEGLALVPYVESLSGIVSAGGDAVRRFYHLPAAPTPPAARGEPLAVQRVRASRGVVDLQGALDGDLRTASILPAPQKAGEWIELDLGSSSAVSGFEYGFGGDVSGAPDHMVIDVSPDGVEWETVWQGRGAQYALAALMRDPRRSRISIGFEPRSVRYLRLRLLTDADAQWRIADLRVLGAGS
jgi:hypothetical protein